MTLGPFRRSTDSCADIKWCERLRTQTETMGGGFDAFRSYKEDACHLSNQKRLQDSDPKWKMQQVVLTMPHFQSQIFRATVQRRQQNAEQ